MASVINGELCGLYIYFYAPIICIKLQRAWLWL